MWANFDLVGLIMIPFCARFITFWTMAGLFAYMDHYYQTNHSQLFLEYKIQGQEIINKGGIDWSKYQKTAKVALQNFIYQLYFMIFTFPLFYWRGISWSNSLLINNSLTFTVLQWLTIYIIQQALFFYGHYSLHHRWFYKRIHKIHHQWIAPVACRAYYTHPIEHLINDIFPLWFPAVLFNLHPFYYTLWSIKMGFDTTRIHSGYRFWWCQAEDHDEHHKYFSCNYGGLSIFDWLHGTRTIDFIKPKKLKIAKN